MYDLRTTCIEFSNISIMFEYFLLNTNCSVWTIFEWRTFFGCRCKLLLQFIQLKRTNTPESYFQLAIPYPPNPPKLCYVYYYECSDIEATIASKTSTKIQHNQNSDNHLACIIPKIIIELRDIYSYFVWCFSDLSSFNNNFVLLNNSE